MFESNKNEKERPLLCFVLSSFYLPLNLHSRYLIGQAQRSSAGFASYWEPSIVGRSKPLSTFPHCHPWSIFCSAALSLLIHLRQSPANFQNKRADRLHHLAVHLWSEVARLCARTNNCWHVMRSDCNNSSQLFTGSPIFMAAQPSLVIQNPK